LSLVDPDNRRPVDFGRRQKLLKKSSRLQAIADWDSGLPKLWLIQRALQLRREHAASFDGAHQPLSARGARLGHLLIYQRGGDVLIAAPRFTFTLDGDWGDTIIGLPVGRWNNAFTDTAHEGEISPGMLVGEVPVALLTRAS